jgi:hypothetical protein
MRLSFKKAAHTNIVGAAQQEIRVLRVLCEGRETTNLDTDRRVSHPLQRTQRTPDSCHAALDKTACAPFSKERRMKFAEPSKLNRNPGGWATRLFVVLPAVPNTSRGLIENLFLIRYK